MKPGQNIMQSQTSLSGGTEGISDRAILMRAIHQGDRQAQEYLYLKFRPFIHQYVKSIGSLDQQVDDLVHDVFLAICQGKCRYSGKTDVRGYLCGIAKHIVQSYIRTEKSRVYACWPGKTDSLGPSVAPNGGGDGPQEHCQRKEIQAAFCRQIARLPEKSREAVELTLIHNIRPAQAALEANCSLVVFRKRLFRGYKKLRKKLCKSPLFF